MDSTSLRMIAEELATLHVLAICAWLGFTLALMAASLEHRRWRRSRTDAQCAVDPEMACPPGRRLSVLTFDCFRSIAVTMAWDGLALLLLILFPSLARVPVINGTFAMATSTALMFEGGMAGMIFFVVLRLGECYGCHRWQQPA